MAEQFFESGFDSSTLLKLDIYRQYLKEWLPVFIEQKPWGAWDGSISIFDFCCGPGHDGDGREGSPLVAINACLEYADRCTAHGKKIDLYFNDAGSDAIAKLKESIHSLDLPPCINVHYSVEDFSKSLSVRMSILEASANLIFIDQFGLKQVSDSVFTSLSRLERTDLLFFIASWHVVRFKKEDSIQAYVKLSTDGNIDFPDSHRGIAAHFRSLLAPGQQYYVAPFSLKKKSSIHGLIFGTGKLLGIEKFLKVAWGLDPRCGEANFDIDGDGFPDPSSSTRDLFEAQMVAKKIDVFQAEIRMRLLAGQFDSDFSLYSFSLGSGFLPSKHARPVLNEVIKTGQLTCEGTPRLSKDCIRAPRKIRLATPGE